MSQAIIDPEEVDSFIREIRAFVENLEQSANRLNGAFGSVSETWQDQKRNEFEEDFKELLHILDRFKTNSEEKTQYLHQLSQKAKDYLGS